MSQTIYGYDESNGSPQGTFGNETSVTHWLSTGSSPKTQTIYNTQGMAKNKIDARGNPTMITYDSTGMFPSMVQQPTTGSIQHIDHFTYNKNTGQMTAHTDPNGVVTSYLYNDPLDRLTQVQAAVGTTIWLPGVSDQSDTAYKYPTATETDVEQDLNLTDDSALVSKSISDGLGRLFKTIARDGSVIETGYDALNRVCVVSNASLATNAPATLGCTVGANKAIAVTDGYTYYSYDALGRKLLQTEPDGKTLQWKYTGNVLDYYDQDGSHWQSTIDGSGRQTKILENDPAGSGVLSLETDFTYDALNNLQSVNQKGASGDTARYRTFIYDSLSRLTNACNPEAIASGSSCSTSGPWSASYSYDGNGNVIKRTDGRGIITQYVYDAMNRLAAKNYTNDPANTPALVYAYDTEYPWQVLNHENQPIGHLNGITAAVGTANVAAWASIDYDHRGNLAGYVTCLGSNVPGCPTALGASATLLYNLDDSLISLSGFSGSPTTYQAFGYNYVLDNADRLNLIQADVSPDYSSSQLVHVANAFSYPTFYPGGAVATATVGNNPGFSLSRTYDNRGRITGEIDTDSTLQKAYSYAVSYDPNGNVMGYNDSVAGAWTETYDALHRLSKSTGTWNGVASTFQQTYDHFGNRNVETLLHGTTQTQPSPYLNFTAGNNRAATWIYDNAGNLLSDGLNNYLYDAEGRICAVEQVTTGGNMIGYLYGANGSRLGKANLTSFTCDLTKNGMLTASGVKLINGYDSGLRGELLEVTDGNFNMQEYNIDWEGKLLATFVGTTYAQSDWSFALNDWVGTKRVVTTSTGACLSTFFNGPFGDYQTSGCSGADPSDQHFTGKERDTESGLDYFGARYYSSNTGRFMSPDSIPGSLDDPQSWNLYSYVRNNPLTNTDPDGHDVQVCDDNGKCNTISNDAYKAAQQANNQGGLNAPTLDQVGNSKDANGNFTSAGITNSSGEQVGSAKYVPGDNPGIDPYVGNNMAGLGTLGAADKAVTVAAVATGVVYGGVAAAELGPGPAAAVGRWGLQRLALGASSPALLNLINRLYQAQDEISGGTAGAVRNEVATGEYINGGHSIKAAEMITALSNLIKSGQLSGSDQMIAGHIISDLKNSLGQ